MTDGTSKTNLSAIGGAVRFVIDENVAMIVANTLNEIGHDCVAIGRLMSGATDEDVMEVARRERRILVTFDADFGRLVFRERRPPPPGIVYLQARPHQTVHLSRLFLSLFGEGNLDPKGFFVILEAGGAVRRLPLKAIPHV